MAYLTQGHIHVEYPSLNQWQDFTADYDPAYYSSGGAAYWTKPDGTVMHPHGDRVDYPPFWWALFNGDYYLSCGFTTNGTSVGGGQWTGNGSGVVWRNYTNSSGNKYDIVTTRTLTLNAADFANVTDNPFPVFKVPFTAQSNPEAWDYGMTGKLPAPTPYAEWEIYNDGVSKTVLYKMPSFSDPDSEAYGLQSVANAVFWATYGSSSGNNKTSVQYNQPYAISLTDLYDATGASDVQRFFNKLMPFSNLDKVTLHMYLEYVNPNDATRNKTAECSVVFNNDGTYVSYQNDQPEKDDSTITVIDGSPTEKDYADIDDQDPVEDDNLDDPAAPDESMSVITNGNRVYMITRTQLNAIISTLWGSFIDNVKLVNNNPIENIISVSILPYTVTAGATAQVAIGNVGFGIQAGTVANNYISLGNISLSCQKMYSKSKFAFLDFAPYTAIDLYLPFVGYQPLDANVVMGNAISINMQSDILSGTVIYTVKCGGKVLLTTTASVASYINITSQNNTEYITRQISNISHELLNVSTGNIGGAIGGAVGIATEPHHISQSGQLSASVAICGYLTPFLRIDRPDYKAPGNFPQSKGYKCVKTYALSTLKGYTVIDDINLSSITYATSDEIADLKDQLQNGVILGTISEITPDGTYTYK